MTDGNDLIVPSHDSYEYHGNNEQIAWITTDGGLTKREEFAARAMIGLLSNAMLVGEDSKINIEWAAKTSVLLSDALISELNKTTTNG